MSESPVGLNVAATRQNAGRSRKAGVGAGGAAAGPAGFGGMNDPEPTACASVIVALGSVSDAKLSAP